MEDHSHSAHDVGAADSDHGHYATEIHGAVTDDDVHWVRREIASLRDSVRDLQAKYKAEHELVEAVRQGAATIPQITAALRGRADMLAIAGQIARGQDPHDFAQELFLQHQLRLLASEIEAS